MSGILTKTRKRNKGFTLIEIVTAVAIFGLLISIFAGIFLSAVKAQQRILNSQRLSDNLSYSLEYMSRALRMAKKDLSGLCVPLYHNYATNEAKDRIWFLNYQNQCQRFVFDPTTGQITEDKSTDHSAVNFSGNPLPLTSADINILSFQVEGVSSWGPPEEKQPRVTLALEVEEGGDIIYLQTMVSQRNLNVIY